MSKGPRIRAIQRLTDHLDNLPTSDDAMLILRQYDAEVPSGWSHFRGMLLRALDALDDNTLFQMVDDLLSADHADAVSASDAPWSSPASLKLFISHSSTQRKLMGQLRSELEKFGVDAFVAHDTIAPTVEWQRAIIAALETCDAFAAWLTPEFIQSRWTDQEVGYALKRDIPILPVKVANQDPHGFIAKFQAVVSDPTDLPITARRIVDGLNTRPELGLKMLHVALARFEGARSYDEARQTIAVLHEHQWPWTPAMLDRLTGAPSKNSQIAEAFGVSTKIQTIVGRYS